jgi:hypothetical protein
MVCMVILIIILMTYWHIRYRGIYREQPFTIHTIHKLSVGIPGDMWWFVVGISGEVEPHIIFTLRV